MSKYAIDETIVDTNKASESWAEATYFDGHNQISKATGDQWRHQILHRSSKGRYYLVDESQYQSEPSTAEWVTPEEAARWLLLMGETLPEDLQSLEVELCE